MYLYERILYTIRGWFRPKAKKNFALDLDTLSTVTRIARKQHRDPEEYANQILSDVFRYQEAYGDLWELWGRLTPREQEVAALICLDYTTRQIAAKLQVAPETVKSHSKNIEKKLAVSNRRELRQVFQMWDFRSWDQ